jgi:Tfp pilus tip-associated adhesin PilY1
MSRYEIRKYSEVGRRKSKPGTFYGVWDNQINNWVVNTMGIGIQTAKRIVKALEKNTNINRPKPFWRE